MYFPKSQIIENLYTNGGELKPFNTETEYTGYYFRTSDNRFFSGKNPNDTPNVPLIPITTETTFSSPTSITTNTKNSRKITEDKDSEPLAENYYLRDDNYYIAKKIGENRGKAPRKPIQSIIIPTQEDYQNKSFERYFVKKGNENQFIEVSKAEFDLFKAKSPDVQFNLYTPINIEWSLVGNKEEVYQSNKTIVSLTEQRQNLPGFILFFKGQFDKFWRAK